MEEERKLKKTGEILVRIKKKNFQEELSETFAKKTLRKIPNENW